MRKNIIKFMMFALVIHSGLSCTKKIDDAYQNPNASVRVPVETLLPQIISAMAANYAGHGTMNDIRYIGAYIQNFAFYNPQSNFDRMGHTNTDVAQSIWRMHYYDIGQNNERMIEWGAEEQKWDYVGVGKAISAWSWLTLTDYHGEVILKESFNTSLLTFKYDTQEEVYEHVRKLCFEALENLNNTGGAASQANLALGDEYMYNGDVNKWKKFVYGVLARYHNHFSNKADYHADSVVHYANLAMLDNADNAMVKFAATAIGATNNFFGPFRNNLNGTGVTSPTAIRQASFIANLMNGTNAEFAGVEDPRAWYMLRGNTAGTIKGVTPVIGQTNSLPVTERPENFWGASQNPTATNAPPTPTNVQKGNFIFRNEAPFPIMTASEMYFLIAEAEWRRNNPGAALAAYREGISKNFDMLTSTFSAGVIAGKEITPAMKAAYMNNTAIVPATPAGLNLSKIMLQKYISLFAHGALETWLDMRRYHYTDTDPATGNQVYRDFVIPTDLFPDNGGKTVQRMRPRFNSEYVWNILELERIGATALDYHTKELWITQ